MGASYVILGDGIAGSSAAETIHEHQPDADVTVVTDEGEPLYNRILIKEFAKGKLPEAPIQIHDQEWYDERDIELRLDTHVVEVDVEEHVLRTHDGDDLAFDKLLVATGGTPADVPGVEGRDAEGVHHFWTFQDARSIREHVETADTGVVVGAGLLGIDLAAICGAHGLDGHYLMRGESWWRYGLTPEGAEIVHDGLREKGVTPVFDSGVDHFEVDDGHVTATVDTNGERYDSEFVGVAIGLNFNTEFLRGTPVETDGGILVDQYMRTDAADVYAAGDITQFHDVILGERTQNGSWGSAKEQGATAARTMLAEVSGTPAEEADVEPFRWVPSYSITHFDFPFLSFGHPTIGDESASRTYGETAWRRLTFKDGKLIGGVLIGDLAPQSAYKTLIREEVPVVDRVEELLAEDVDAASFTAPREQVPEGS